MRNHFSIFQNQVKIIIFDSLEKNEELYVVFLHRNNLELLLKRKLFCNN